RLPEAGTGLQAPVDVFLPRYRSVPVPPDAVSEPPLVIPDPQSGGPLRAGVVNVIADGYRLRLVDVPAAFDRETIYDHSDDAWRFAVFCRVALAALRRDGTPLDVLHVHDWHTGPALLDRARGEAAGDPFLAGMAVLVTLHNLAYHGRVRAADVGMLGLAGSDPDGVDLLAGSDPDGVDLLRLAIEGADLANTVSPGFGREALTPAFGRGLDATLRAKGDRFFSILNGIDPDVWNPATDTVLAAPYDAADPSGKAACRADLLGRVEFDPADDGVVLGMIGRLDPQKGFDLLADGARDLLAAGVRIIVQGSGHAVLAAPFRALAAAEPRHVALIERFDRDMARRIYAGADLFLMPSRFEPCGQGQMISLRYGTPPVVRRTGGLADTVVDVDERPGEGTGFVFDEATPAALVAAVLRASRLRASDPAGWADLRRRGMAVDFNWVTGSAPEYLEAYRRAIGLRRG
ncbi:MAG: glycogen/starch synthase, partial [Chloroflexota bacterium]|nr:glycogen/starch synthase [Chloroflexota bacterium]